MLICRINRKCHFEISGLSRNGTEGKFYRTLNTSTSIYQVPFKQTFWSAVSSAYNGFSLFTYTLSDRVLRSHREAQC